MRYLNEKPWIVERSFGWAARFRRLVKDYERLPATVVGLHFVAFACLFLHRAIAVLWVESITAATAASIIIGPIDGERHNCLLVEVL